MSAQTRAWTIAFAIALLPLLARLASAQVQASNLLDAQIGNIPFTDPHDRTDVYDQFLLDVRVSTLRAGLRFESDHNSEDTYIYAKVTQRYADWSDGPLRTRVGNFYTILGRGLVHRSFELPGVVLDPAFLRSRYGLSRDVDGVLAEATSAHLSARAFSGTPNGGEFPPSGASIGLDPYAGQLSGGQLVATLARGVKIGATAEKSSAAGTRDLHLGSGFVDFDPLRLFKSSVALPLYAEYAQGDQSFGDWWRFSTADTVPHALYAGANLLWGPVALAAEWKHYRSFRLGTNDPPSLVREHSDVLLNRNTHVLNANREEGHQLEGTFVSGAWGTLTANASRAEGRLGKKPAVFLEHFIELRTPADPARRFDAAAFFDEGQDEFVGVSERRTGGANATVRLWAGFSLTADLEHLRATRVRTSFDDHFLLIEAARAAWGSLALVWERTTDPTQETPSAALEPGITPRNFVRVSVSGDVGSRSHVALTIGEQRGGLGCTSGTCYQVLSFKGAQLRVTTRL
ncbi:MAG: hypothetical protein HYR73_04750 [Candidatus Eisenbacteria bacterium]|nr:hypothetical protein [Candidatus Eisenbacteria bacterium]